MKKSSILFITRAALVAAFYVLLGIISNIFGLDSGVIQLRLSESLCVLPVISGAYVAGVTAGCLIFNMLFTGSVVDMVFGTLATLIGAILAKLFKKHKYLAFIPTVISNSVIIPLVICYGTMNGDLTALPLIMLSVAVGEIISCGVLGNLLLRTASQRKLL